MRKDWKDLAKCKGEDVNFFFPEVGQGDGKNIRRYCADCPVKTDCAEYAITNNIRWGWWGGLSQNQLETLCSKYAEDGVLMVVA